jgi:hypothetical protein
MAGVGFTEGGVQINYFATPRDPLVHLEGVPAAQMAALDRRFLDANGRVPNADR